MAMNFAEQLWVISFFVHTRIKPRDLPEGNYEEFRHEVEEIFEERRWTNRS